MRKIGILFLAICLLFLKSASAKQSGFDASTEQLQQISTARKMALKFIVFANHGDLKNVKKLCTKKIDPLAPSAGDGDNVIGFKTGDELKKSWSALQFKIQSVQYSPQKGKAGPFIIVWLRPTKGKWDGDTGLVFKPSVGKFVSVFDGSE